MDIRKMDETYIERTYGRFAPLLVSGAGSIAYDEDGTRYIDRASRSTHSVSRMRS